nr:hypothetical protein B0A51_04908 [Rachicladosporium sp. CCFEE 5018]
MSTPIIPATPLEKILKEISFASPIKRPHQSRYTTPPPLPTVCKDRGYSMTEFRDFRRQRLPAYVSDELFTCSDFVYSRKNVESMNRVAKSRLGKGWLSNRKLLLLSEEESMYERLKKALKKKSVNHGRRLRRRFRITKKQAPNTSKSPLRRNTVAPIPTTPWDESEMDPWIFLDDLDRPNSALRNDTEPYLAAHRAIEQLIAKGQASMQDITTPGAAMHATVYVTELWRSRRITQSPGDPMDLDDRHANVIPRCTKTRAPSTANITGHRVDALGTPPPPPRRASSTANITGDRAVASDYHLNERQAQPTLSATVADDSNRTPHTSHANVIPRCTTTEDQVQPTLPATVSTPEDRRRRQATANIQVTVADVLEIEMWRTAEPFNHHKITERSSQTVQSCFALLKAG